MCIRDSNSTFSIVGGTLALVAIMAFIVLIVLNVNRSVRIREKLEEANLLAQKTIESRHRLLLSVSHDIKTPMNSILGYLDISDADGKLSAQEIAAMRNSGRHILALLENLLEYSGLEQGTLQAVMEPFNVRAVSYTHLGIWRLQCKSNALSDKCPIYKCIRL